MNRSNQIKSKQLGIPYGTACNRLRKQIMFHLLVKLGDNTCFKCKQKINKAEDLSIEHKQPWLHINNELFWNMDNIAFSHLKCNKPDRPSRGNHHKCPYGTIWCPSCKQCLPRNNFGRRKPTKENARNVRTYCYNCLRTKKNWHHNSRKKL